MIPFTENLTSRHYGEPDCMPINHFQLGIHFLCYNGYRFIMNSEKQKAFPEDDAFAENQIDLLKMSNVSF